MNWLKTKHLRLPCLVTCVVVLSVLAGAVEISAETAGDSSSHSTGVLNLETLPVNGYNITKEGSSDVIEMGDFALTSSPGDPMLPHKIYDILIPPNAIEQTVTLNVVSSQKKVLEGTYSIKPAGPDVTSIDGQMVEVWGNGKAIANGKNLNVYQSNADFPTSIVKILGISQMRKWKFVRVDLSPIQYNPVSGQLTLTENIQIEISYELSMELQDATMISDSAFDDVAEKQFVNFEQQKDSYPQGEESQGDQPSLPPYDYVIITTDAIKNNSLKLNSFVNHKQNNMGHSVYVATYENDIQTLTGQSPDNRAEKIRQFLINNYLSWDIEYVLLIGDPSPYESGEGDIPMKMCHPENNQSNSQVVQTPTDYFYADLTGNWDVDGDQYYGEWDPDGNGTTWSGDFPVTNGVDFAQEVYVGRIPVYDADYTALDNILQKIIDYETESGNLNWRSNILLPMGFQASGYDGAQLAEQMDFDYLGSSGYSTWKMYQQGSAYATDNSAYTSDEELRGSPGPYPAGQDTVENEWTNDSVYGIHCWWAHGSATSASVGYGTANWDGTLFQSSYCASLDDDHPAFTYQCSCNNGSPENSSNLQYKILENGGIGTVSSTRVSWFNTGVSYGNFDGSTTNSGIGYEYVDRLVQNLDDGVALYQAKSSMTPASPTRLMNYYDFNLYGCPAVDIQLGSISAVKWEQPPDETENGIDIRCDRNDGVMRTLADDFLCTQSGPITKVIFWGSWFNDIKEEIENVHLSIHSDLPANDPGNPDEYSMPKDLLWEKDFLANEVNETEYLYSTDGEWFWDPVIGDPPPTQRADHVIWKYEIDIPRSEAFVQQGDPCDPVVYWLDIYVDLQDPAGGEQPKFGWKSSSEHWNDDAVWSDNEGATWNELRYPPQHPYADDSIDLSFVIVTGEPEPNDIKWSQPPVPWEEEGIYVGWDEESHEMFPRMVLDDFRCDTTKPLTAIRWWGSFLGWRSIDVPSQLPKGFYITIWTDVPDPDPQDPTTYSHPNEIIWENYCMTYDVNFFGWEWDPAMQEVDLSKFEFYQELDPCDYWYQPGDANIYWIGIGALYDEDPCYPWGWETREHFFQDDAVRFFNWPQPGVSYPPEDFEPIKLFEETWDLSFELVSREKEPPPKEPVRHLKWSQPPIEIDPLSDIPTFCGWDQPSYHSYQETDWYIVADDFRCIGPMPVTSIHWWGSYSGWQQAGALPPLLPDSWHIGFWSNKRADDPPANIDYSYPDVLLHEFTVPGWRVQQEEVGQDEYYPEEPPYLPSDTCFQYYLDLDPNEVFWQEDFNEQTTDNIYWLSIVPQYTVETPVEYPWGWKTRPWSWMDDAVTFNIYEFPDVGFITDPYTITPIKDPVWQESFDVSFELDTDPNYIKWEQDYTGIRHWPHYEDEMSTFNLDEERLVADDWQCLRRTPITALSWWGSYIGYGYDACTYEFMPLPVPPEKFELKIWSDVPASENARTIAAGSTDDYVYVYDGQGNSLFSYDTGADVAAVAVSDDGTYIAVGSFGNKLYLFTRDGTKVWEKNIPITNSGAGWMGTESKTVAISANGEYIVAGCSDKLYVYKKDGTLLWTHDGQETCVDISPNGDYIAACEISGNAHLFSTTSGAPLWTKTNINSFWIATSDPGYVALSDFTTVYLIDNSGTQIWSYADAKWNSDYIRLDMTQDGLGIVAVNDDPSDSPGCILAYLNDMKDGNPGWSAADGTAVWRFDPLGGSGDSDFYSVAISADGEYIATGPTGGSYVHHKSSSVPVQTISMGTANSYDLTEDGKYGACGDRQGNLYYFANDSNTPIWTKTDPNEKVHVVAISNYGFSHPKDIIWEYETAEYDEVLVGYDKHPHGEPNEPVFRYSLRLPEDEWFHQPDYNGIFWLSIQAIYETAPPVYDWGWTNHKHVFNDDAVAAYPMGIPPEEIEWEELYDQTGESQDMSFILFTDPNECSNCANYNLDALVNFLDYADFTDDWTWTGPVGGYNNSDLDCNGIVDLYDLDIFCDQWLTSCP